MMQNNNGKKKIKFYLQDYPDTVVYITIVNSVD